MAVTETYTADLNSRTYTGTANRNEGHATHGNYQNGNGDWVGMVRLPVSLKGKRITAITMRLTANTAGSTSSKTVYIWSSNFDSPDEKGTGSIFPNQQLGSIDGRFRNATTEVKLSGDLLEKVAECYSLGERMLILYDPTSHIDNYCRFTNIEITVTYEESSTGTVKYKVNGEWVKCKVHLMVNGMYEQVIPHVMVNGMYEECSSS